MAVPDVERDGPERGETEVGRAPRFALATTSSIPPLWKQQAPSGILDSAAAGDGHHGLTASAPRFEISFRDFRNFGNFASDRQAHISPKIFWFFLKKCEFG